MLSICCRCLHWSDETHILLPSYISPSRNDFFFRAQSLFICSVCGIQMFYAHYVIPLKTSWMLSFIYAFRIAVDYIMAMSWRLKQDQGHLCLSLSNQSGCMKGRHPFHTLASSKFEWKLLPTAAALVGRRVCGTQHGLARTPRYEIADNNLGLPQQSRSNVAGNETAQEGKWAKRLDYITLVLMNRRRRGTERLITPQSCWKGLKQKSSFNLQDILLWSCTHFIV